MAGGFPQQMLVCNGTDIGTLTASSNATTVTASATPNTKGSWTQLIASSTLDTDWLIISVSGYGVVGPSVSIDVGIGAASSEKIIAADLLLAQKNSQTSDGEIFEVPCSIPTGTRIAVRCQSPNASETVGVAAYLFSSGYMSPGGYAGVDAIGFLSASTLGTLIDPGGTINTKGSYAQLTASSLRDYVGFFAILDGQLTATTGSGSFLVDIAIGAGGSEIVIVPNIHVGKESSTTVAWIYQHRTPTFWIDIPSGTRIAARSQSDGNVVNARKIGITLYGLYQ